jgi:hypothetical protein
MRECICAVGVGAECRMTKTLDVTLVFIAKHPIMEKFGPYCFIGVAPLILNSPFPLSECPK